MWSVLAALVPSFGALIVAGDVLVEQIRLRSERRVRYRIGDRVEALRQRLMDETDVLHIDVFEVKRRCDARETRLLNLNGIETPRPTYRDMDVEVAMSAPVLPTRETVRQWILLGSALAGIVLLGVALA